jgi:hypothetical protein
MNLLVYKPKIVLFILTAICIIGLFSCSASYKTINLNNISGTKTDKFGLTIQIDPDVLQNSGNNRFEGKARSASLFVIGLSVTNSGDIPVILDPQKISLVDSSGIDAEAIYSGAAGEMNKLSEWLYAFWSLLFVAVDNIIIPIGILIAAVEVKGAMDANKNMVAEYDSLMIKRKVLNPEENTTGLLFYHIDNYNKHWILQINITDEDGNHIGIFELPASPDPTARIVPDLRAADALAVRRNRE